MSTAASKSTSSESSTPAVPATFEGRSLPRLGEELTDQGLAFDLATLVTRRQALRVLGLGTAALGLAACGNGSSSGSASAEIPDETEGPYPGDGSNGPDVLEQTGVVRRDIRSSFGEATGTADGVPMTLEMEIKDLANGGAPFVGVAVYVWHCDREGRYSLYSDGVTEENYLRGVQITDSDGKVSFDSVFPACYSGRWPHVHFEVFPDQASIADDSTIIATSQLALPQDASEAVYAQRGYETSVQNMAEVSLDDDHEFGDDGGGRQLATATGDVRTGYTVVLSVGVDTRTEPSGGWWDDLWN
jgi:protocatechuate 3,4-dioxygenase beta subunit